MTSGAAGACCPSAGFSGGCALTFSSIATVSPRSSSLEFTPTPSLFWSKAPPTALKDIVNPNSDLLPVAGLMSPGPGPRLLTVGDVRIAPLSHISQAKETEIANSDTTWRQTK